MLRAAALSFVVVATLCLAEAKDAKCDCTSKDLKVNPPLRMARRRCCFTLSSYCRMLSGARGVVATRGRVSSLCLTSLSQAKAESISTLEGSLASLKKEVSRKLSPEPLCGADAAASRPLGGS